jgi:putative intracellular protease/amidase
MVAREEGYEAHIASPSKKKLHFVVHDFVAGFDTYTEKPGHTWQAHLAFADVDPADYVACVIPGGRAPEYIRNDEDCKRVVRAFFGDDRHVAQLCHGPLVTAAAGGRSKPTESRCINSRIQPGWSGQASPETRPRGCRGRTREGEHRESHRWPEARARA